MKSRPGSSAGGPGRRPGIRPGAAGFTLLEMMVYLVVSGIVVGAIVSVMMSQQRDHVRQKEVSRVRLNLAAAAAMMTSDLRPLSASDGDLVTMEEDSVAFRGVVGSGIVCDTVNGGSPTFHIANVQGEFSRARSDSVLLFAASSPGPADDTWRVLELQTASYNPGKAYKCAWGAAFSAPYRVSVAGDTAGVRVGGPVTAFRRVAYALLQEGSEWYLSRRIGSGNWGRVAGPLLGPGQDGLRFAYLDQAGNATTVPGEVRAIEIELRARREDPWGTNTRIDSLKTIVHVRGG